MSETPNELISDLPCSGCQSGQNAPSRRTFLKTVVIAAATLVVLPATMASADNVPITWVDLGSQPEPGVAWTQIILPASFNSEAVFIRKVTPTIPSNAAPIYQAVSARCTHRHCVVAYHPDTVTFVCPCHGGTFDSNSYPIAGPPKSALPPLLAQWTPTSGGNGHLLIEAPNAVTSAPES